VARPSFSRKLPLYAVVMPSQGPKYEVGEVEGDLGSTGTLKKIASEI